jgi:hypothetical protein
MENEVTREEDRIREEMKETRSALTEKLEKLEEKVSSTVEGATSTVTDTVQTVKETVQDTTSAVTETVGAIKDSVKETVGVIKDTVAEGVQGLGEMLNLKRQTERHPCGVFAGAIVAGFVGGKLLLPSAAPASTAPPTPKPTGAHHGNGELRERMRGEDAQQDESPGWLGKLQQEFGAEIAQLKSMAIGMLMQGVKDLLVNSLPAQWKPQVEQLMSRVGAKLTGRDESKSAEERQQSQTPAQPSSGPWSAAAEKFSGAGAS